jgi:SprT-like family/2-cysteine adaptor domain
MDISELTTLNVSKLRKLAKQYGVYDTSKKSGLVKSIKEAIDKSKQTDYFEKCLKRSKEDIYKMSNSLRLYPNKDTQQYDMCEELTWLQEGGVSGVGEMDECDEWIRDKKVNPRTMRRISPRGKVYQSLKEKCIPEMDVNDEFLALYKYPRTIRSKDEVLKYFFNLFNRRVFDGKLSGKIRFKWYPGEDAIGYIVFLSDLSKNVKIMLSTEYIKNSDQLRDVLIHLLCHAATHIIDDDVDGNKHLHGEEWYKWAMLSEERFELLPIIHPACRKQQSLILKSQIRDIRQRQMQRNTIRRIPAQSSLSSDVRTNTSNERVNLFNLDISPILATTNTSESVQLPPPFPVAAPRRKPSPVAAPRLKPSPVAAPRRKPSPVAAPRLKPSPVASPHTQQHGNNLIASSKPDDITENDIETSESSQSRQSNPIPCQQQQQSETNDEDDASIDDMFELSSRLQQQQRRIINAIRHIPQSPVRNSPVNADTINTREKHLFDDETTLVQPPPPFDGDTSSSDDERTFVPPTPTPLQQRHIQQSQAQSQAQSSPANADHTPDITRRQYFASSKTSTPLNNGRTAVSRGRLNDSLFGRTSPIQNDFRNNATPWSHPLAYVPGSIFHPPVTERPINSLSSPISPTSSTLNISNTLSRVKPSVPLRTSSLTERSHTRSITSPPLNTTTTNTNDIQPSRSQTSLVNNSLVNNSLVNNSLVNNSLTSAQPPAYMDAVNSLNRSSMYANFEPPMPRVYYMTDDKINLIKYKSFCDVNNIKPEETVFVFPGNIGHHSGSQTLFSIKRGSGLARVAEQLGKNGIPTLSLPTTIIAIGDLTIPKKAVGDIWKAIGYGLHVIIPVRMHMNDKYFKDSIQIRYSDYEPSFWGGVEQTPNINLADYYLSQIKLMNSVTVNKEFELDYNMGLQAKYGGTVSEWYSPNKKDGPYTRTRSQTSQIRAGNAK